MERRQLAGVTAIHDEGGRAGCNEAELQREPNSLFNGLYKLGWTH